MTKHLLALLALLVILPAAPARAEDEFYEPVQAMYMVRDPASKSGYTEKLRWTINNANDWFRFYDNLPGLPKEPTTIADPLKGKVDDMIVFTHTDDNDLTGFDVYVTNRGLMVVKRGATHRFYPDSNMLRSYLLTEQKQRASYEALSEEKISSKSIGIVVTYNINKSIPNPVWLVSSVDEMRIYNSFFKALKPYSGEQLKDLLDREEYGFGSFVMNLNYASAPARIATVGRGSIRMSEGYTKTDFYQDTEDYYKYFKDQARDMIRFKESYKVDENEAAKRREF